MTKLRLLYGLIAVLSAGVLACKKDRIVAPQAEAATDGKAMIKGCVWFKTKGENDTDVIAFCDDGRVCTQGHDDWHCIQFVSPPKTQEPPPCGEGSGSSTGGPPAEAPPVAP